jgi:hypothetical protein
MFYPLRRNNLNRHFQLFALSAVLTIVVVRSFLFLTGYPQIGGGETGLHIAHMLWGGLLMLVAILLDIFFVDPRLFNLRVLISGIGFGLFIDELGKFVTSDNDYFFKPTFSIVYILFVVIVLVAKRIDDRTEFSKEEIEANKFFDQQSYLDRFAPQASRLIKRISDSSLFRFILSGLAIAELVKAVVTIILLVGLFYSDQLFNLTEVTITIIAGIFAAAVSAFLLIGITGISRHRVRLEQNLWRASVLSLGTTQVLIFSVSNVTGLIFLMLGLGFYLLVQLHLLKTTGSS